jgi:hypothetical protein
MIEKFETSAPVMALFLPYMKCAVCEFHCESSGRSYWSSIPFQSNIGHHGSIGAGKLPLGKAEAEICFSAVWETACADNGTNVKENLFFPTQPHTSMPANAPF